MRYLSNAIAEDLPERMVFLGGPRQCGKTTLAKALVADSGHGKYYNWDNRQDRRHILDATWPTETDLIVFDEIHKYRQWKSLIKGYWDTRPKKLQMFATGSARLDIYRRGGDSLLGRYHYYRLHPFSAAELAGSVKKYPHAKTPPRLDFSKKSKDIPKLLKFGGFPEPLFRGEERFLSRWQKERFERVFREDIRSWELVQDLAQLELLADLLPGRVGSPLSMASLTEDIATTPKSIKLWLEVLSRNYFAFSVMPWHARLDRALKKEAKFFLWDYSVIEDVGPRFENMVACHILKFCHYYRDVNGIDIDLRYVRDREKREVDFLLVYDKKPWMLIEAKVGKPDNFGPLRYFAEKLRVKEKYMICLDEKHDYLDRASGTTVIPAAKFFAALV